MHFLEQTFSFWDNSHNLWLIILAASAVLLWFLISCLRYFSGYWLKNTKKKNLLRKEFSSSYKNKLIEERNRDLTVFQNLVDRNVTPIPSSVYDEKLITQNPVEDENVPTEEENIRFIEQFNAEGGEEVSDDFNEMTTYNNHLQITTSTVTTTTTTNTSTSSFDGSDSNEVKQITTTTTTSSNTSENTGGDMGNPAPFNQAFDPFGGSDL